MIGIPFATEDNPDALQPIGWPFVADQSVFALRAAPDPDADCGEMATPIKPAAAQHRVVCERTHVPALENLRLSTGSQYWGGECLGMRADKEKAISGNRLYFGDNLDVLRDHVKDATVDLVYLDPPFNSRANYNVLFKERSGAPTQSQAEAFCDTCPS